MFDYLDRNKDGFVCYKEFCYLCEEKRRGIDPFDANNKVSKEKDYEMEKLERMSMASNFYKGYKSSKLKSSKNY